tara:strand:- start:5954 stop:7351 length:1398 start_codon:yes stop_codon:yes gene_type:complete
MKIFKTSLMITTLICLVACQSIVDDINDINPNKIGTVDGETLFTAMQLANTTAQSGYLNWAAGIWTGNFVGAGKMGPEQNYQYVNTNSNTPWANIYVGVVKQAREIRSGIEVTNKYFYYGASKVIEAHAIGTAVNVFGDVPYSEASDDEISTPKYDSQTDVYAALQLLLNEAISDLQAAATNGGISEDIYFGGDSNKWIKAAYTLKARLFLDVRNYSSALTAAQNGISSESESMKYYPPAIVLTGDTNLLNQFMTGSFSDDLATKGSFLIDLIGTGSSSRNNTKTNEVDRAAYYYDGLDINLSGIAANNEPMNQISYQENLLTWAEASLRSSPNNFNSALAKLNEHRANLKNGVYFTANSGVYDDYIETDFVSTGIENVDGSLSKEDALLREIIEERHVSFFADILSFNDLRRTKKDPATLQVPVPINTGSNHPERFLYPFDEENTNGTNVPDITNIFEKTKINQ